MFHASLLVVDVLWCFPGTVSKSLVSEFLGVCYKGMSEIIIRITRASPLFLVGNVCGNLRQGVQAQVNASEFEPIVSTTTDGIRLIQNSQENCMVSLAINPG